MTNIVARLIDRCLTSPDRIALGFHRDGRWDDWTYRRLLHRAHDHAQALASRGVRPGERVLILMEFDSDVAAAFLGAMLHGAVPGFLSPPTPKLQPDLYASHLSALIDSSGAVAVILDRASAAPVARSLREQSRIARILREEVLEGPAVPVVEMPQANAAGGDVAFVQYSSGTTGLRKAVPLSHVKVLAQAERLACALALSPTDRISSWLPLYHDMGLIGSFIAPLIMGIPADMSCPFAWTARPRLLLEMLATRRGTLAFLPNFAFNHLALTVEERPRLDLGHVRALINCSEVCRADSHDRFVARFQNWGIGHEQLMTCYAMAEAVFATTATVPGQPVRRMHVDADSFASHGSVIAATPGRRVQTCLSVGRPLPGMQVRIIGEHGEPLPENQVGEIEIAGPCVFDGYLSANGSATGKRADGWFATGDRGFLSDGEMFVTGRLKDTIIVNGRNVHAPDIEAIALRVHGIKPGRAVALPLFNDVSGSEDILILAEAREPERMEQPPDLRVVARELRRAVAEHTGLNPRVDFVPPGWLVKTSSGKLARHENLKRYQDFLVIRTGEKVQNADA
ncbi:AMP-binding protein [Azospirillum sp.]|uniref:AMP-binding protein n=1 Tax=Azospirillum sp. TaxID=34012 RepID=UPI00261A75DA|nr:AMP-binding protein [Azospirillum sp.]